MKKGIQLHDRTASPDLFTFLQSAKLLEEGLTLAELNDHNFFSFNVLDSQMGSFQGRFPFLHVVFNCLDFPILTL